MELGLLSILAFGFFLGIKHAIEPDHIIAVSTIASNSKKLWRSSLSGVFWGIGHTATLFIIGIILIIFKHEISDQLAMSLEFMVGIMLVYLGITSLTSFKNMHSNEHQHKDVSYTKSLLVGTVHGLAGSAAMILLTMSTVESVWQGALYIIVFGAGTVLGMLIFTTVIGLPFVLSSNNKGLNKRFTQVAGLVSTAFGLYYMYNLGVTEGLFKLWLGN